MSTKSIGSEAEQLVADYLQNDGYEIIELNWRRPHAEIDIVAKKHKTIYFVEVKYRSNMSAGDGFDYITSTKLMHMKRAAESWLQENDWEQQSQLMAAAVDALANIDIREV